MTGGYDDGYERCSCLWGRSPGRLIYKLEGIVGGFVGYKVLDAGCGEGKNAVYLSRSGADVLAVDVSKLALINAVENWPQVERVQWQRANVLDLTLKPAYFDLIVAYGLLHCLQSRDEIESFVSSAKVATKPGGFHIICTFNARRQELHAHPRLLPTLMPHNFYVDLYADWSIIVSSDEDLYETHPHNNIAHTHSMSRLIVQGPGD